MNTARNERTIYDILTHLLKKARDEQQPITSVEAFDNNDVRRFAETVNKVSDTLGHMWRRGDMVDRFPAPKQFNSQAKFSYQWKPEPKAAPKAISPKHDQALDRSIRMGATSVPDAGASTRRVVIERPTIQVSDDGANVVIDLPSLQIIIRSRA